MLDHSKPSRSKNGRNWPEITVSKTFRIIDVRAILRQLSGSGGPPCFRLGGIIAFLHGEGKVCRMRGKKKTM